MVKEMDKKSEDDRLYTSNRTGDHQKATENNKRDLKIAKEVGDRTRQERA